MYTNFGLMGSVYGFISGDVSGNEYVFAFEPVIRK
jgi:hypothetical protein